jgi:hypothetical protein
MGITHMSDWHLWSTSGSHDREGDHVTFVACLSGIVRDGATDEVLGVSHALQGSGRTVGVISHVEELKHALLTGISVTSRDHESTMDVSHLGDNDG